MNRVPLAILGHLILYQLFSTKYLKKDSFNFSIIKWLIIKWTVFFRELKAPTASSILRWLVSRKSWFQQRLILFLVVYKIIICSETNCFENQWISLYNNRFITFFFCYPISISFDAIPKFIFSNDNKCICITCTALQIDLGVFPYQNHRTIVYCLWT